MKSEKFNTIVKEAAKRYKEYKDLASGATVDMGYPLRKEDHIEYWIAVVAWETGWDDAR